MTSFGVRSFYEDTEDQSIKSTTQKYTELEPVDCEKYIKIGSDSYSCAEFGSRSAATRETNSPNNGKIYRRSNRKAYCKGSSRTNNKSYTDCKSGSENTDSGIYSENNSERYKDTKTRSYSINRGIYRSTNNGDSRSRKYNTNSGIYSGSYRDTDTESYSDTKSRRLSIYNDIYSRSNSESYTATNTGSYSDSNRSYSTYTGIHSGETNKGSYWGTNSGNYSGTNSRSNSGTYSYSYSSSTADTGSAGDSTAYNRSGSLHLDSSDGSTQSAKLDEMAETAGIIIFTLWYLAIAFNYAVYPIIERRNRRYQCKCIACAELSPLSSCEFDTPVVVDSKKPDHDNNDHDTPVVVHSKKPDHDNNDHDTPVVVDSKKPDHDNNDHNTPVVVDSKKPDHDNNDHDVQLVADSKKPHHGNNDQPKEIGILDVIEAVAEAIDEANVDNGGGDDPLIEENQEEISDDE